LSVFSFVITLDGGELGAWVAQYRFYPIQKDGHLLGPPRIMDLPDDDAAIKAAKELTDERPIEIWQRARMVTRVSPLSL
jgi:hypothetical protein